MAARFMAAMSLTYKPALQRMDEAASRDVPATFYSSQTRGDQLAVHGRQSLPAIGLTSAAVG